MARPQKEGLDYFPLDTDMDLKDDKVQLVEAKYGAVGFAVLIKLLMKIYSEGYCYQWGENEGLLFSKRVNVDINTVNDIVNDLVKWGMFDTEIYIKYSVLTSNGIQKRFWEVAKRRNDIIINKAFWVHDVNKILISANITLLNVDIGTQRKGKKRIVKDSKEYSSEIIRMADRLKFLILQNNPGAKIPTDLTKWQSDFDRMKRLDKRTDEQIFAVMEFSQKDPFWKANILSAGKLREKFDTLLLQKDRPKPQQKPTAVNKANFDQRKYTDEDFEKLYKV